MTTPTANQRMWQKAAETLTPDQSLGRVEAKGGQILGSISLIGTALAGLGLFSSKWTDLHQPATTLAGCAVGFAALALILSLFSTLLRFSPRLHSHNLLDVESWFRGQLQRAWFVQIAGICLLIGLICAAAAAVTNVVVAPAENTDPAVTVQLTRATGGQTLVTSATVKTLTDGPLELTLTGLGPGSEVVLARGQLSPSAVSPDTLTTAPVVVDGYHQLKITVLMADRTCTETVDLLAAPATDTGPGLSCTRA